jgi:nucleoside-diphosphate-sugar epimerase
MIRHRQERPQHPRRVVVLGASGFVAGELIAHLGALGVEALGLPSSRYDLRDPSTADLLRGALRSDDALVFTAALTPDRGRDVRTFMANLAMAETVGSVLETTTVAHVVYVSSDAVYPDDAGPVRETTPCDPPGLHGLMHLTRERVLAHSLSRTKTPLLILRPAPLYGARDSHNNYGPNRFVRSALAEQRVELFGGGEERRDHVFIKDLSRLTALALGHRSEGVLNVATGASVSFREVAELVAERVPETVVASTPRRGPIDHRDFDVTERVRAFPGFNVTRLTRALDDVVNKLALPRRGS